MTIRVDGGVVEGSEISLFYDPMIAKLCAHAPSRAAAIDAMADALDAFAIDGIRHNIPFLAALMAHPRWREGRLSTAFIAQEFPDGFHGVIAGRGADDDSCRDCRLRRDRLHAATTPAEGSESVRSRVARDLVLALGREHLPVQIIDSADRSGSLDIRHRRWPANLGGVGLASGRAASGAARSTASRSSRRSGVRATQ